MAVGLDKSLESSLVRLVNEDLMNLDVYLEKYQKVDLYVYSEEVIKEILKTFKFKNIGNVYDFPDSLPQPDTINGFDMSMNFDIFQRIAVSRKINSIVFYTTNGHNIHCTFLIDIEHLKKFSKVSKTLLQQDSHSNMFEKTNFECADNEYIEISEAHEDSLKHTEAIKKKVPKEKLVFVKNSILSDIMGDITIFFKDETRKLYEKMQIAYKRGIILYGDPGNGKSALIREVIRHNSKVIKVMINPNVENITKILSALIKSLAGKYVIIIIEDIDSLITNRNRSEFLNILDGVDIKSGIYFIGTTNYPDQIDPAFMNRSGRFDRTYKVENPTAEVRLAYFRDRNIGELLSEYKVYKDDSKPDNDEGVVDLFVKNSADLAMATLKEVMTSTQYMLAGNPDMSVEEAVEKTYNLLTTSRNEHAEAHDKYKQRTTNDFRLSGVRKNSYNDI